MTIGVQGLLDFTQKVERPGVDERDLYTLIYLLDDCDWTLASDIPGFSDRKLRTLANASSGKIISGNRGYKLTRNATIQEIDECTSRLRSQADRMNQRVIEINRVYHGHQTSRNTSADAVHSH